MSKKPVYVVSGLPRSGTSMMMKMLEAGGLEAMTDSAREADEDNPGGYYEFALVKKMKEDTSWVSQAMGKVVKVISQLLYYLPKELDYKVVFMRRYMDEILASQRLMLERQGKEGEEVSEEELRRAFLQHLQEVSNWLGGQPNFEVLNVSYKEVVQNPQEQSRQIARFLGLDLDIQAMAAAVDESLYRQRLQKH
jgi:hypothetical protein